MIVRLVRGYTGKEGTFGMLSDEDGPLCVSCELPWKENKTAISCIPEGEYSVVPHTGLKFKNVWEVQKVPGRVGILIHPANTIKDLKGCIAPGKSFGVVEGLTAVLESQWTMDFLQHTLPKTFLLKVVNAF